ncbi:MAG TPA: hypothetical protein PLI06_04930 [Methanofastidiosum sp.]|nr:hypothetical protein [Methanofastidiosum sp.]
MRKNPLNLLYKRRSVRSFYSSIVSLIYVAIEKNLAELKAGILR